MKQPLSDSKTSKGKKLQHLLLGAERKKRNTRILVAVAILVFLSPKLFDISGAFADTPEEAPAPMRLDAMVVQPGIFEQKITATGNLLANSRVNLSTEVSGKIIALNIDEGAAVKKGDLLMRINNRDLLAQLKGARFDLTLLEDSENRNRQLLEKGGITQEAYDAIRGDLNNKRAEVELILAEIQKTEIRAPFDGVLGLRHVDPGAYVTPNVQIASLQDMEKIKIEFAIPERYSNQISVEDDIRFEVQGVDSVFSGKVFAIEPQIDTRSRTFMVRAISDNKEGLLHPGSFAEVTLVLSTTEDALLIPNIALIPEGTDFKVFTYENGTAVAKKVKVGARDSELVNILEGLNPSDTILLNGLLSVEDGSMVALKNMEAQHE